MKLQSREELKQLRHNQHRERFLQAMQTHGLKDPQSISFISVDEAVASGTRIHQVLRCIETSQVENWEEAKKRLIDNFPGGDIFVIFTNLWDIGAMLLAATTLRSNIQAIYETVGPDLYCATLDMSHGIVYDSDEFSCSLRMW